MCAHLIISSSDVNDDSRNSVVLDAMGPHLGALLSKKNSACMCVCVRVCVCACVCARTLSNALVFGTSVEAEATRRMRTLLKAHMNQSVINKMADMPFSSKCLPSAGICATKQIQCE